jgi:hypothetical protein
MSGRWASIPLNDEHVHVVPLEDGLIHEPEDDCICGPEIEAVQRSDGSFGWLVIHASLDGRERDEDHP